MISKKTQKQIKHRRMLEEILDIDEREILAEIKRSKNE